jgi:hypothetical protein
MCPRQDVVPLAFHVIERLEDYDLACEFLRSDKDKRYKEPFVYLASTSRLPDFLQRSMTRPPKKQKFNEYGLKPLKSVPLDPGV